MFVTGYVGCYVAHGSITKLLLTCLTITLHVARSVLNLCPLSDPFVADPLDAQGSGTRAVE